MEQLVDFLAFATGVVWLTAGSLLAASVRRSRSRSDLILGLSFIVGSIQIGITTGALAGHGAFPVETLLILFALLWISFGDEANSLQPGDLKSMLAISAVGTVILHFVGQFVGIQPLTSVGSYSLRLLELMPLLLAVHIAYHIYPRLRTSFSSLAPCHVRELLVATSAASLASFVGGAYGDLFRFALLILAPTAFLWRRHATEGRRISRTAAIACACGLGLIGLRAVEHAATRTQHLQAAMTHLTTANSHTARLQFEVEVAHSSRVHDDAESEYAHHSDSALAAVNSLIGLARLEGSSTMVDAGARVKQALLEHRRSSRELFAQIALSNAAWGDEEAARKAASLAESAHVETRSKDRICADSLESLGHLWLAQPEQLDDALAGIRDTLLALTTATALLGLALWLMGMRNARLEVTETNEGVKTIELRSKDSSTPFDEVPEHDALMSMFDPDLLSVLQSTGEEQPEPQVDSGCPRP